MTELPESWTQVRVGDISKSIQYGYTASASDAPAGAKMLRITDIQNGVVNWGTVPFCEIDELNRLKFSLEPGDIVFARTGGTVGKSFLIRRVPEPAVFASYLIRVSVSPTIAPDYLYWFFQSLSYWEQIGLKKGGLQGNVNASTLATISLNLPPLPEQHRIVAKIEALFSELDAGQDSLTRAQAQLRLYRQSLLKAAFQGRLTADWRAANPDKLESPETLLSRIRTERDARYKQALDGWQNALADWRAGGELGRKPAKPSRPAEVDALDASALGELPALPLGWTYIQLAHLGDLARGKSRHRPRNDPRLFGGPYPFIQTGEVKAAGRKITSFSETYSEFGLLQSRLWPTGTLCITIAANIAETAFLGFDGCFPDSVVGFTAFENVVEPIFVELFIKAARVEISAYAPATAQKNINLTTLEELVVPYCGPDEQCELTRRIDALFSSVDAIELEITTALAKITALRQSILKQAFSGRLVPQDPADEPASALLARLRATPPPARTKRKTTA